MKNLKVSKLIMNYNADSICNTTEKDFIDHASRYIKAAKDKRLICSIESEAKSGISSTMRFVELSGTNKNGFYLYNFYELFVILGFRKVTDSDYFRVYGSDVVYTSHYRVVKEFKNLSIITEKTFDELNQITPHLL